MRKFNVYDLIVNLFTGDDGMRPAMMQVNKSGDYLVATDAISLIRMDVSLVANKDNYQDNEKYPNWQTVWDDARERTLITTIVKVDDLIECFQGAKNYMLKEDCEACDGAGYEECKCCGSEKDCKVCDGSGEDNVEVTFSDVIWRNSDKEDRMQVGNSFFHFNYVYKLITVAKFLRLDEIEMQQSEPNKASFFKFEDGVELMLMPMVSG